MLEVDIAIKILWGSTMKKITTPLLTGLLLASAASYSTVTLAQQSEHDVTGNIGITSGYYLRGMTNAPESDKATIQGGLDYSHSSGFYAGWWGSTLDYSLDDYDPVFDTYVGNDAFEHDFYAGYNGSFSDDFGYSLGVVYYYYYPSDADADGFESVLGLNYKNVSVTANTLLQDVVWGNAGDTYVQFNYSRELPKDFSFNSAVGVSYYDKNGKYLKDTDDSFGFRHMTVGLSKELGDTGVTANMDYIIAGYDRYDDKQKNKVVFGLGYSF